MTRRKVCAGRAPRSAEASASERGTRSKAATMGRTMNGSHTYRKTRNVPRYEVDKRGPAHHRQGQEGIEERGQPEPTSEPGDDALLGEDQLPRVDPHEIAGPEREHDAEVEQRLQSEAGAPHHVVGQGEREGGRRHRDRERHEGRPQHDVEVRDGEELPVCRERQLVHDQARELVDPKEALDEEGEQGAEVHHAEPEERRTEEEDQEQPRAEIERRGETLERRRRGAGGRGHAESPPAPWSGCSCRADQVRRTRCPDTPRGLASSACCSSTRSCPPPSRLTV